MPQCRHQPKNSRILLHKTCLLFSKKLVVKTLKEAQRLLPETLFISIGDREADIYALFERALEDDNNPALIIRARNDRKIADTDDGLWNQVDLEPVIGKFEVHVAQKKGDVSKRVAEVEVRIREVEIMPPGYQKTGTKGLWVWAVHAQEKNPPEGVEKLDWMLLTTCPVKTMADAETILKYYTHRWQIEVYFRTLKTGCNIENRMLSKASSIEACLAVDMVSAWRVFYLVKLGRETPDVSCEVFFDKYEWRALVVRITKQSPPQEPIKLGEAVQMLARLGGYIGKKSGPPPGPKAIWKGLEKLVDCTEMYITMACVERPSDERHSCSSA